MKHFLIIISLFMCFTLKAQTPFTAMHSEQSIVGKRVSANNPWIGAGLKYNIKGDISDILLNGRVYYTPISDDKFAIPISAEVENDSMAVGVFPYYKIKDGDLTILAHSGFEYDLDNTFRILAGVEFALYGEDNTPFTLSIAPEILFTDKTSYGIGITGVLPIANSLGLLVDVTTGQRSQVSFGIIVNSQL